MKNKAKIKLRPCNFDTPYIDIASYSPDFIPHW